MSSDQNQPSNDGVSVELVDVTKLRRHEQIDLDKADALLKDFVAEPIWTVPLLVERRSNVILDGHHRFWCACQLGLVSVPALLIEYCDADLTLETWRPGTPVTIDDVLTAASSGALMAHKTSRHRLSRPLPSCSYPLSDLRSPRRGVAA